MENSSINIPSLPPISSFDSLVRAAETKYRNVDADSNDDRNGSPLGKNFTHASMPNYKKTMLPSSRRSGLLSYQLLTSKNNSSASISQDSYASTRTSDVESEAREESIASENSKVGGDLRGKITMTEPLVLPASVPMEMPVAAPIASNAATAIDIPPQLRAETLASVDYMPEITMEDGLHSIYSAAMLSSDSLLKRRRGDIMSPPIPKLKTPTIATNNSNVKSRSVTPAVPAPTNATLINDPLVSAKTKRRKKQCPICSGYYANLTTHKATHLVPEDRPHKCPICQRGFGRNNDLIRHQKRHWKDALPEGKKASGGGAVANGTESAHDHLKSLHQLSGAYKCPYNSTLIQLDMEMYPFKKQLINFETLNCHPSGIFSRGDTFKNHLKALHFQYPAGTKKTERNSVPGNCKHCGKHFANVEVWLHDHVGEECGYRYN
ncbi:hypothetical protein NCAS_0J01300 [Naumovozyma castellii]|uniref:C2H2-type domain-containing protein n=1 Tax=Naumovozyma castellii TaxID=27288 RepID=G0VKS1_NAUCA|nr:hypothetical protein NCAS_0J01300 [Naumovozyma castellii CBS 4309]CCC72109.1 hypothetical protein NCAS_0J01300 [Naumovozyma castellii CBS 4309]